ncbi:unnamed protein product, partial [Soboliphyme baturini]|uniref:Protein disulfide-isomerase n=1 Tax=Soboliphyme baturini TaxID=241478 RepID=A0A183ILG3_9BILA
TDEGKKICKKFKAYPDKVAIKHYHNGEFNRDYERPRKLATMVRFLSDPTGEPAWEEDPASVDVVHMHSSKALLSYLKKEKLPVFVMFYAPWCTHCKKLKSPFAEVATELKGKTVLIGVDLMEQENRPIESVYNITGFPTLLYFENGHFKFQYNGERDKESILKWLKSPAFSEVPGEPSSWADEKSDVVHLSDATFDSFIAKQLNAIVMFYAPWCGHCKKLKPAYTEAARMLKESSVRGTFAAIDATTNPGVSERFKLQGYPTLKYFQHGTFVMDVDERSADGLVNFMSNPPDASKIPSTPAPPAQEEMDWGNVVQLTSASFQGELRSKKFALVMFYAPWCGHCKAAKPEFIAAAQSFSGESRVVFGAVDCTVENNLCSAYHVQGFPTIIFFSYLKLQIPYNGQRAATDFIGFIKSRISSEEAEQEKSDHETPLNQVTEFGKDVFVLTPENFAPKLEPLDKAVVFFHADWCVHCQNAKEAYSKAATKLRNKILLTSFSCTEYPGFCMEHGLMGYPSIFFYANGKLSAIYNGDRSTKSFVEKFSGEPDKMEQKSKTEL